MTRVIKEAIKELLPDGVIRTLQWVLTPLRDRDLPFLYPYVVRLLGSSLAPREPPILLVSLPRSGSTWVGSILGFSDNSLYLQEPLTYSYMRLFPSAASFFEIDACRDKNHYRTLARNAFSGVPNFDKVILKHPDQWDLRTRSKRHIVIKEVNPLILGWILREYSPKVIYLLRHPVSVANSFYAKGWTGEQFQRRFTPQTLRDLETRFQIDYHADFWEQSGALQAIVQNMAMDVLSSASDFLVVKYEDICVSPLEQFAKLFRFSKLSLTGKVVDRIEQTTHSRGSYGPGEDGTVRDSAKMRNRWRSVPDQNIELVRRGYLTNQPYYYREGW